MTKLPTPIAAGRTAEIYRWDDRHVLKLYQGWCPPDWADYEARVAGIVHEAGIPSPGVGKIIEVNARRGLIYEYIEGISMLQDMNARPWMLWKHARTLAELHVKINQQLVQGLPPYKDRLCYDIRNSHQLSDELREKVLAMIGDLPAGKYLCHGDYHPGNVLITANGPVVIDWMTASVGSPWTDVARTSLILSIGAAAAKDKVHPIIRMAIRMYRRSYRAHYLEQMPDADNEMKRWMPVIAAARLNENIAPEREALLHIVKEGYADDSDS